MEAHVGGARNGSRGTSHGAKAAYGKRAVTKATDELQVANHVVGSMQRSTEQWMDYTYRFHKSLWSRGAPLKHPDYISHLEDENRSMTRYNKAVEQYNKMYNDLPTRKKYKMKSLKELGYKEKFQLHKL